jgi:hypothetical protein
MCECAKAAAERKIACLKFSLQDWRPESLSDKLGARYTDTQNATLHIDSEMISRLRPPTDEESDPCGAAIFQSRGFRFQKDKRVSRR